MRIRCKNHEIILPNYLQIVEKLLDSADSIAQYEWKEENFSFAHNLFLFFFLQL